jgi:hypothetical protein
MSTTIFSGRARMVRGQTIEGSWKVRVAILEQRGAG